MAKVDSNVEVTIKKARLSFEHIFKAQTPKPDKDGKVGAPTFNCAFLVSKKDGKMLDEIEDAIAECKKKMWGDKPPKIREDRTPYRDGEDYEYDGYPGNMVISARNQRAPQVVHSKKDEDGKFVRLDGSEGVIYSGCYVNGIIRFWAQDSQDYGKRINCSLEVVQFYADGDAFSGASKVDAEDRLSGLEGEVKDEDPRTEGRRRERDRDRGDDDAGRGSRRDRDDDRTERKKEDDDGRSRARGRRDEEDEGERRPSRDREGGRDRDGRDSGRGRDRDEDRSEERPRRSRDEGDDEPRRDRGASRDVDARESDRGSSRRSSERDEPRGRDDRDERRDRERSSRSREDDDRPRSRSRDDDDEPPRRRSSRNDDLI